MTLKDSLVTAALFVGLLWVVWLADRVTPTLPFAQFGINPREESGVVGIALAPLIHGGRLHLVANSAPMFVLSAISLYFYRGVIWIAGPFIYFVSGVLVWLFARESFHIGASGLIYGLAAFILFSGLFRRRVLPLLLAVLIAVLYGGLVWGVLPLTPGVSWESHLFGAVSGGTSAYLFRKVARDDG